MIDGEKGREEKERMVVGEEEEKEKKEVVEKRKMKKKLCGENKKSSTGSDSRLKRTLSAFETTALAAALREWERVRIRALSEKERHRRFCCSVWLSHHIEMISFRLRGFLFSSTGGLY